jgi:hypothetical protein
MHSLKVEVDGRKFQVAVDAIKAINIMKGGNAMDGAFSKSPQTVRDTLKQNASPPQQEPPVQRTGGLWQP